MRLTETLKEGPKCWQARPLSNLERHLENRRLVAGDIVELVLDDIIAGRRAAHVQRQDHHEFEIAGMALGRDPHEVLFFGKHFATARLDLEIDNEPQFKHALAGILPAKADGLGVDDDLLALFELLRATLLVKPEAARLALDEQRPP